MLFDGKSHDPSGMNHEPDPYGRDATRPYQIPLKGWWQVSQRVWSESNRDNLSVVAAGCAFFALFAIFPALSALISLYGLTADPAIVEKQFGMLNSVLPTQAYDMVIEQIHRISAASGRTLGWSLAVSLGLALWSANAGTQAMLAALNIAYGEPDRRSLFQYYLNAFTFTIIGILGGWSCFSPSSTCRSCSPLLAIPTPSSSSSVLCAGRFSRSSCSS
jgi:membrane protein